MKFPLFGNGCSLLWCIFLLLVINDSVFVRITKAFEALESGMCDVMKIRQKGMQREVEKENGRLILKQL